MTRLASILVASMFIFSAPAWSETIQEQIKRFKYEDRPLPANVLYLIDLDKGPLADTTTTCNDDTNICTCVSDTDDGECGPILQSLCDSDVSWSNGGVGEDCPSPTDE